MQPGTGQSGDTRQVGDLQRVGCMLINMRIERRIGQAPTAHHLRFGMVEAGQQQHRTLLRDQRITDLAGRQPVHQLALPGIQRQAPGVVEQAPAGLRVITQ
ncbi:hypothetical protein D3C85_1529740 [compost metagenome]